MARQDPDNSGGYDLLRRWTVLVLLALLSFTTVMEVVDSIFFGGLFNTDPAFYGLVGGMVSGLFLAEVVRVARDREGAEKKNWRREDETDGA